MAKSTLELVCMCEPPFGRAGSESCARRARRGVTRFRCVACAGRGHRHGALEP
jgi:hypothetical protein